MLRKKIFILFLFFIFLLSTKAFATEIQEIDINLDNLVNECLVAIKKYNIALEIKKLEKEIKEENDIDKQVKLMEEIRFLKTKEGKSW